MADDSDGTSGADRYGPIVTSAQVCDLLQVTPQTVQRLAREGRLPAHRLPGSRKYLFFLDDVLELLRQHRVQPKDAAEDTDTPAPEASA